MQDYRPKKTWWDKLKAKLPSARWIMTPRGGINMPKYQPCPECGKGSRRNRKVETGAIYSCCNHGEFLVKA